MLEKTNEELALGVRSKGTGTKGEIRAINKFKAVIQTHEVIYQTKLKIPISLKKVLWEFLLYFV